MPTPNASHAGFTSRSTPRWSRLYWFCAEMNGARFRVSAIQCDDAICQPAKFEWPRYRTLPSRTRSSSARSVSSSGVFASGKCT